MGEIVAKLGVSPQWMSNPHLHHILSVNGRAGAERALVREGQEILHAVKIDPLKGLQNLTWAPNRGHTVAETGKLVQELRLAAGSRAKVELVLKTFGEIARGR